VIPVKLNRLFSTHILFAITMAMVPAFATLAPAASAQVAPTGAEVQAGYKPGLSAGDQIEVISPDLAEAGDLKLIIGPDGAVNFPYIGEIVLAGLTPRQAEEAITKALKEKEIINEPNITLNVTAGRNYSVTILGEVKVPGRYPMFSTTPLAIVLSSAGGLTPNADLHILISHPDGSEPDDVDVSRDMHDLHALNTQVNPGDVVAVVTAGTFFALGEFNHPGAFPIVGTQHMTLIQALATAGGLTPVAGLSKSRILRTVDGHREEIVVDMLKLQHGEIADPLIHTDDIIYVPRNNSKALSNNWLGTALTLTGLGLSLATFLK
jgi:polysaccharide export outer membrane protein